MHFFFFQPFQFVTAVNRTFVKMAQSALSMIVDLSASVHRDTKVLIVMVRNKDHVCCYSLSLITGTKYTINLTCINCVDRSFFSQIKNRI